MINGLLHGILEMVGSISITWILATGCLTVIFLIAYGRDN